MKYKKIQHFFLPFVNRKEQPCIKKNKTQRTCGFVKNTAVPPGAVTARPNTEKNMLRTSSIRTYMHSSRGSHTWLSCEEVQSGTALISLCKHSRAVRRCVCKTPGGKPEQHLARKRQATLYPPPARPRLPIPLLCLSSVMFTCCCVDGSPSSLQVTRPSEICRCCCCCCLLPRLSDIAGFPSAARCRCACKSVACTYM